MRFELLSHDGVKFGVWDHGLSKVVGNGKGAQFATTSREEAEEAVNTMNARVFSLVTEIVSLLDTNPWDTPVPA